MPTKTRKSNKGLTIKSNETRITAGVAVFVIGLGAVLSTFMTDATIFSVFSENLGKSSVIWGIAIIYISLRLITLKQRFKSIKFLSGVIVLALVSTVLLTFFIPQEEISSMSSYATAGGNMGFFFHETLFQTLGPILEFIVISFIGIIGITLSTTLTLEQIIEGFVKMFSKIGSFFQKQSLETVDGLKVGFEDNENEQKTFLNKKDVKNKEFLGELQTISNASVSKNDVIGSTTIKTALSNSNSNPENSKQPLQYIEGKIVKPTENTGEKKENEDANIFEPMYPNWKYPSSNLFKEGVFKPQNAELHRKNASIIEKTLRSFGIESKVVNTAVGPTVVQYALSITVGTKVAKVMNSANDLALALAATSAGVRIEAPIPGTSLIGIEVPNPTPNFVYVRDMLADLENEKAKYDLPIVLGKTVTGQKITKDLTEMPHLLVAGATGTGKSIGINTILAGLLSTKSPDELRLILVDPKMVEMALFNGIPHLLIPVITDMELVINALQWAVDEMMKRYRILKQERVRKIKEYNQKMGYNAMPYIVIIIDEMADLMLQKGVDVESKIVRLTQMSRAVGIHLILATQRPSVNVITGLIKANVPSRMSFSVATGIDSSVIIDQRGAETLIGKGDMLFKSPEYPKPIRIQDAWTDTKDIEAVVEFIKDQTDEVHYFDDIVKAKVEDKKEEDGNGTDPNGYDSMFEDSLAVVINAQKASASLLQRKLRIGYNRAARIIDELEEAGAIGPAEGSNSRKVLVSSVSQILGNKSVSAGDPDIDIQNELDFDANNENANGIEDLID